jgi:methionyl-tRNA formyltransferase
MHPSLLPRHRGAAPIYHTLLQDDKVGGISVIELHKTKFDAGRVSSFLYFNSLYVPLFSIDTLSRKNSDSA